MRVFWLGLAAVGICIAPVSAATPIESKPGKPWKHKATGAALPDILAGLPRTNMVYFTSPEVDVAADYQNADGTEAVTLYVYRDVSGSVPVWFDRSRFYIMNLPDKFGTATSTGVRPFTPRGQKVASGLIDSFSVTKGPKTTGLMIFPFNGFLRENPGEFRDARCAGPGSSDGGSDQCDRLVEQNFGGGRSAYG
jgi:hypothetical protein